MTKTISYYVHLGALLHSFQFTIFTLPRSFLKKIHKDKVASKIGLWAFGKDLYITILHKIYMIQVFVLNDIYWVETNVRTGFLVPSLWDPGTSSLLAHALYMQSSPLKHS